MYLGSSITHNSSLTIILQLELDAIAMETFFYEQVMFFPNAIIGYIYTDPSDNSSEIYTVSDDTLDYNATELMLSN